MYRYVEIPRTFSLRQLHMGHQTGLSVLDGGYLGLANHVVISHQGNERRDSGERAENHPFAVAEGVRLIGGSVIAQCVAKMHDVLEEILKTGNMQLFTKTIGEIVRTFPREVPFAVQVLTKFDPEIYYDQLYLGNCKMPDVIMPTKMIDKLHNIKTIFGFDLQKQHRYLLETLGGFMDLCQRSLEFVSAEYPELVPDYEGLIRQLREEASYKLRRVERKLAG